MILACQINLLMFLVESTAGICGRSSGLLADSLDMLADSSVYALSLYALDRHRRWGAGAALCKGIMMLTLSVAVLVRAAWAPRLGLVPEPATMALVSFFAFAANALCVGLLFIHRRGSLDLRASWLCSRNDLLANIAVLLAAGPTAWLDSPWPDTIVAFALAGLLVWTAVGILRAVVAELARSSDGPCRDRCSVG